MWFLFCFVLWLASSKRQIRKLGIVSQNLLIDYLKPVTGTRPYNGGKTSAMDRRNQRDSKSTISGDQISTKTTVAVATKQQKILSTSETRVLV